MIHIKRGQKRGHYVSEPRGLIRWLNLLVSKNVKIIPHPSPVSITWGIRGKREAGGKKLAFFEKCVIIYPTE